MSSFDWAKYVDLAIWIDAQRQGVVSRAPVCDETLIRACFSRAYYGVFNLARVAAIQQKCIREKGEKDIHKKVLDFVGGNATLQPQHRALKALKLLRVWADYNHEGPGACIVNGSKLNPADIPMYIALAKRAAVEIPKAAARLRHVP